MYSTCFYLYITSLKKEIRQDNSVQIETLSLFPGQESRWAETMLNLAALLLWSRTSFLSAIFKRESFTPLASSRIYEGIISQLQKKWLLAAASSTQWKIFPLCAAPSSVCLPLFCCRVSKLLVFIETHSSLVWQKKCMGIVVVLPSDSLSLIRERRPANGKQWHTFLSVAEK